MPRIRLIAGPNGSGKTTLFTTLQEHNDVHFGQYINPDDVALTLKDYSVNGSLIDPKNTAKMSQKICTGLRERYLDLGLSLTYESVMSHESHLEYIKRAKAKGYKTYLYYVCINDPEVNIARVKERVGSGGHGVPDEKVIGRYKRSLENLYEMTMLCERVYYFDNSYEQELFAEKSENALLKIKVDKYNKLKPLWFQKNILEKWDKSKIRY
ncbi:zeta toxin family protein [Pseudoalteromonas ostreae]|uniref:zeta toxin family protein n=1 Tax=Pseudoalteromonas ostreae TaxID=2774154 RepID=UPI001B36AAC5|nr:zeta toxin family protein [Pseudoalteromonas ostreae]